MALQLGHQLVHGHIALGVVLGLAADDQRRARFIDQDGVHLIDDGVMQFALHAIGRLVHHVVAQVVKTKLVVGAVGDVAGICRLLFFARHLRQVDAHRQAQKVIQAPHPLRIALGQVVVDRHHMHPATGQGIQVNSQGGGEGLALTGAHFSHFAMVQCHATAELHIKVTHLHDALGAFSHNSKSFWQQIVQRRSVSHLLFEGLRFGFERLVTEQLQTRLHGIDACHGLAVLFEQALIATAEYLGQKFKGHGWCINPSGRGAQEGEGFL